MNSLQDLRTADYTPAPEQLPQLPASPLRLHLVGLGDVGRAAAVGFRLLGGERLCAIGLYDLNEAQCARMVLELGQILPPCGGRSLPKAGTVTEDALFACDVFLFCATRGVPPLGAGGDVRMAQFAANRELVAHYARAAAAANFKGLFGVVSDPVDLLCLAAFEAAKDAGGLAPGQIQGFGLGVMYARAAWYAAELALPEFAADGRVFGPHGAGLVAANSIREAGYNEAVSLALTEKTIQANLAVRELGFKPYIAPALSSCVMSVLAAVSGRWNDSARYLHGLWFGARNRLTASGTEWEATPLPAPLFTRIAKSYHDLEQTWLDVNC